MKTKIWEIKNSQLDTVETLNQLNEIKNALEHGEIVGIPTETVFGLAGDARNPIAVSKIFKAKQRPEDNPLIVHVHSIKQVERYIPNLDDKVKSLMDHFWPGPISFILPYNGTDFAKNTTAHLNSVAIRMPAHPVGLKILEHINIPLAAPSANLSGKPSPTDYSHVLDDLDGRVFGVVKSEASIFGLESTVLDCTEYPYRIARPGAITKSEIEQFIHDKISEKSYKSSKPISPGMKYKHYAPKQPLKIIEQGITEVTEFDHHNKIGVIGPASTRAFIPEDAYFIELCEDEYDYLNASKNLYSSLRKMDHSDVEMIYIHGFPKNDQTEALRNRMIRAAGDPLIEGDK